MLWEQNCASGTFASFSCRERSATEELKESIALLWLQESNIIYTLILEAKGLKKKNGVRRTMKAIM